jgi:dTDP-4-amino-4,6-dideoxygalactose transaminase
VKVPLLDLVSQHASIRSEIEAAVNAVVERQGFVMGPEVAELERKVADVSGARHGVACASGTDALLLTFRGLDMAPGDEVITPAFTFFATAGAIHNAGGTPVFADIDPGTFNLDPAATEAAITPRTKAIVVVHLFGQMADMEALGSIAEKHGVALIEDAAQAIGARRMVGGDWRRAGELGLAGTLSFFPTKNLGGWGDGGMIVLQDDDVAARLRRMRLHGGGREYHHDEIGLNSRLDSLQAAVLLAKLPHLESWSAARRAHAARYSDGFAGLEQVTPPTTDPANEHIFHQYTIRAERRDELQQHLNDSGVGNKIYYPVALHLQPCFDNLGYRPGSLPTTEEAMTTVLSLPIYPELTESQVNRVVDEVRAFYG